MKEDGPRWLTDVVSECCGPVMKAAGLKVGDPAFARSALQKLVEIDRLRRIGVADDVNWGNSTVCESELTTELSPRRGRIGRNHPGGLGIDAACMLDDGVGQGNPRA